MTLLNVARKRLNHAVATMLLFSAVLASTLTGAPLYANSNAQPTLPTVTLSINNAQLKTEIANTAQQRYMGLSFRQTMADSEAMLFVYDREQALIFTMRNTLIPLSIAFVSKDFVINEIVDMPVGAKQNFPSQKPAQFALEVNQGWFARNGVGVGDQIKIQ